MGNFTAGAFRVQMHGLCTDVCIHLCFSGQQQQYEYRLDGIIKKLHLDLLYQLKKKNAFFLLPIHFQSQKCTWAIDDKLSLSKSFSKINIFTSAFASLGYSVALDFEKLNISRNRTSMLPCACWIFFNCLVI